MLNSLFHCLTRCATFWWQPCLTTSSRSVTTSHHFLQTDKTHYRCGCHRALSLQYKQKLCRGTEVEQTILLYFFGKAFPSASLHTYLDSFWGRQIPTQRKVFPSLCSAMRALPRWTILHPVNTTQQTKRFGMVFRARNISLCSGHVGWSVRVTFS